MAVTSQSIDGKTFYSDSVGTGGIDIEIDYTSYYTAIANNLKQINGCILKTAATIISSTLTINTVEDDIFAGMFVESPNVSEGTLVVAVATDVGAGTTTITLSEAVSTTLNNEPCLFLSANIYLARKSLSINSNLQNILTQITNIATQTTNIATQTTNIATQTTSIAGNQTTMADKITSIESKASNDGIRITGPYEWLSMSSLLRIYDEQGVDLGRLRQEFLSRVPKDF